jgi:8-amino-3,8-dideoxy-alpha-D-manno-octulosonate transaminase
MTTGEGGMVITSDEEMWRTMSEYHDHGHDHAVNPGGRGGEGRSFIGFNYRMMELQGAMGIAQLAKLDGMISAQRRHKARLRDAASAIPGVKFRKLVDEAGDTATFFAFILESRDQCQKVSTILADEGVPAINFSENTWHFYPSWEHLHKGAAVAASGYPFNDSGGKRRIIYDPDVLPKSAELMARTLIYPIAIKMDETQLAKICQALEKAAEA